MGNAGHFHRAVAGVLGILAVCVLSVWPAQGQDGAGSYRDRTTAALVQLDLAGQLLAQGDAADAGAAIERMGRGVADLATMASGFREVANQEFSRCGSRVEELDRRIGDIAAEQQRVTTEIGELEATLAGAVESARISSDQVTAINLRIEASNNALRERVERMEELAKWWWVPGYGAYLGIRTLADHDIEETQSLVNTLNDERVRLNDATRTREAATRLRAELSGQIANDDHMAQELEAMHLHAVARMGELRATALFLTEAEAFWLKSVTLLQVRVEGAGADVQLLISLLGKELQLSDFNDESRPQLTTMREALDAFAASIDRGSSYLLESGTDYCGGPPREATARQLSTKCNISAITQYYEIIDPVSCSFRYAVPPGCPPAARAVDPSPAAMDAGRTRGTWTQAAAQNWIGKPSTSPCLIPATIYYGKVPAPGQCEAACQADPFCTAWTFNERNGFIPNSIGQCWGAPQDYQLNKTEWGGFISGGMR